MASLNCTCLAKRVKFSFGRDQSHCGIYFFRAYSPPWGTVLASHPARPGRIHLNPENVGDINFLPFIRSNENPDFAEEYVGSGQNLLC